MNTHVEIRPTHHYSMFETALGPMGIAWSEHGVTRLQLPEADRDATERRLRRKLAAIRPQTPPPAIAEVMGKIQHYTLGASVDFATVVIDLGDVEPFHRQVYDAARLIAWGRTASYGELARRVGSPEAARAVGRALGHNPVPIIIPCHRVLAKGDRLGGFSAFGGIVLKERLLVLEGLRLI